MNRKLTIQEKRRAEKFEALSKKYWQNGYEENDLTVSVCAANIQRTLLALPFAAGFAIALVSDFRQPNALFIFGCFDTASFIGLFYQYRSILRFVSRLRYFSFL